MKKSTLFFIWFQIAVFTVAFGQTIVKKEADTPVYNEIPKEAIFIHYNSGTLFSGETLLYKIYCLNADKGTLSTLSKIAYIELVGADNNFVFEHKIKLNSGKGQGDFLIPVEIPSGNYKLIGYTQWMKNESSTLFFQGDVMVVNPYEKKSKQVTVKERDLMSKRVYKTTASTTTKDSKFTKGSIALSVDTIFHKKRERVSLTVTLLDGAKTYGNYSLSVRKITTIDSQPIKTSQNFRNSSENIKSIKSKSIYLPELRGEMVSGKIVSKETGEYIPNTDVAISIPGKAYILDMATTNEKGRFFFNLDRDYDGENAVIQILGEIEGVKIQTDTQTSGGYSNLEFPPFRIDSQMKTLIEKRSIHSQIENVYSEIKQDSIVPTAITYPFFYDKNFDIFDLDDYKRFPSVRETFIEVIKYASIRNIEGKPEFMVLPSNPQLNSFSLPLVIADGILLQNHNDIIEFGAKNIKRILVFREKYFYGSRSYQGALVFETLNGDYFQKIDTKDKHIVELFKPQPKKNYFKQKYETNDNSESSHIPDYRYQLLWEPNLLVDTSKMTIDFFTSDVSGKFEIRLEGFTYKGESVSLSKIIVVE